MPETVAVGDAGQPDQSGDARAAVLAGIPVTDHRMTIAGVETAVLVGGDGPPMVLLPGPGESALFWARVLPDLVRTHRVIAPDLPGTGDSDHLPTLDADAVLAWLDALVERVCTAAPVIVGHVVGGAVAARYGLRHPDKVAQIVLVDTLGLRRFFPAPAFGFRLMRFLAQPTQDRFGPFLDQCMFDADGMKSGLADRWKPFADYYVAGVRDEDRKEAMGGLIKHFGATRIQDLHALEVPTALIWGRHDKATPLKTAQAASRRYGWPIFIVEESGDDPKLERPAEFVAALQEALEVLRDRPHPGSPRTSPAPRIGRP